jgi:hypothetical protein
MEIALKVWFEFVVLRIEATWRFGGNACIIMGKSRRKDIAGARQAINAMVMPP